MLQALSLATLTLAAPPQDAAESLAPRSLLEAVPADAVLAVVVEDFPALWSLAKASAWAEVMRAEEFAPLWAMLDSALRAELVPGESSVDEVLDEIHSAAFFLQSFVEGEPANGGLLLRLRQDHTAVRELFHTTLGELVEHAGREVVLLELDARDEWRALLDWRDGFALAFSATREEALERVVTMAIQLEEGSPGEGLAARLQDQRRAGAGGTELYLDLGAVAAGKAAEMNEDERAGLEPFALDDLGWLSVHAWLGEGVAGEVVTRIELPRTGLIARWAACARPLPIELARLAPANAIEVALLGYDVRSAWDVLREAMDAYMPEGAQYLEEGLAAARDTAGVDLEADLIEQLTGQLAEILLPIELEIEMESASGMGMGPTIGSLMLSPFVLGLSGLPATSPGSVLVVGLHETDSVEDVLESMLELSGAGELVEDERVAGRWMTTVVPPDAWLQPSWAFLDGALLFSLQADPVRAMLAQAAEDAPPGWLEAQSEDPFADDGAFAASVADLDRWVQAEIVQPVTWLVDLFADAGADIEEGSYEDVGFGIVRALPALVAEHLQGRMRSTMTVEAGALVYRVWTE